MNPLPISKSTHKYAGALAWFDLFEWISSILILLFLYAATSKLLEYEKFLAQTRQSSLLSPYAELIVIFVPVLELLACVLLSTRKTRLAGLALSFILMCLFSAYIYIVLHFEQNIPCSCGGILENMSWQQHLYFNLFFVLLTLLSITGYPNPENQKYSHAQDESGAAENL